MSRPLHPKTPLDILVTQINENFIEINNHLRQNQIKQIDGSTAMIVGELQNGKYGMQLNGTDGQPSMYLGELESGDKGIQLNESNGEPSIVFGELENGDKGLMLYLNGQPHIILTASSGLVAAKPGIDVTTLL